jgi:hypothetical protein
MVPNWHYSFMILSKHIIKYLFISNTLITFITQILDLFKLKLFFLLLSFLESNDLLMLFYDSKS